MHLLSLETGAKYNLLENNTQAGIMHKNKVTTLKAYLAFKKLQNKCFNFWKDWYSIKFPSFIFL